MVANLPAESQGDYNCDMETTPTTNMVPSSLSAAPLASREHIVVTPGVCSGKPRVDGTRITVANIVVWFERQGLSADEIVSGWPSLTLADVHAALAYYHDHREAIEARMEADERFVEELMKSQSLNVPLAQQAKETP